MISSAPDSRPPVLVTTRSFGSGDADPAGLLEAAGLRVVRADPDHDLDAIKEPLADAVAWIPGTGPIDERHLSLAPNLKIVARHGAGVDSVDLAATAARGVTVTNTPGANSEAVADHALGLMLAAIRHLLDADSAARNGTHPVLRGRELSALTVGLVGFGNIGRAVARRLVAGFGARILVYDPYVEPEGLKAIGVDPVSDLQDLAAEADVVSLHVPGEAGTLVDAAFVGRMKAGAVLVNTARGGLVDEDAVAAALIDGRLGAAAVDVLASEPSLASPLLDAPNTIVTPHISAQTTEAIDRMGMTSAEEVIRVIRGEAPRHPVAPRA